MESFYVQDDYKPTKNLQLNLGIRWDYSEAFVDQVRNNVGGGVVNTSGNLTQNKLLFTAGARFQTVANLLVGVNFGAGPAWQDLLVRGPLGNVVLAGKDTSLAFTAGIEVLIPVFENVHAGPYLQFTRTTRSTPRSPTGRRPRSAATRRSWSASSSTCWRAAATPGAELCLSSERRAAQLNLNPGPAERWLGTGPSTSSRICASVCPARTQL